MPEGSKAASAQAHTMPLCDMVMEGGVTSGVIYPLAAVELSRQFRLKNLGGTSVGALAAAVVAAAEVGRLRDPEGNPGYRRLARLPEELQARGFSSDKVSRLFDLFQPQAPTRRLFHVLAATLNCTTLKQRLARALAAVATQYALFLAGPALAAFLLLAWLGVAGAAGWASAVLVALAAGAGVVGWKLWRDVTRGLGGNGFGLCTGYLENADASLAPGDPREPLTLWLSRLINESAGKAADDTPLTFGELWAPTDDARSAPPEWLARAGVKEWRYVDLRVISTNLTHGRPYCFPYDDADQFLFFDPAELKRWFPAAVVEHMVAKARVYANECRGGQPRQLREGLLMLPAWKDVPVVFAARLSLSFPLLLSAVPLYAIDYEHPDHDRRGFERCWFSDGGICSNFPIHFFDSPLPLWPTFGIKLEEEGKYRRIDDEADGASNRFFLPTRNEKGRGERFARFDEQQGADRLFGFIGAILASARHWQHHMLIRAPGVRDRVLRVYLKPNEGGLNLNMERPILERLTQVGKDGADKLVERFAAGSTHPMGFDNHRWVRLRNLSAVLEKELSSIGTALAADPSGMTPWWALPAAAARCPDQDCYRPTDEQQEKMLAMLDSLRDMSTLAHTSSELLQQGAPRRAPTIRLVPRL